jgi:hypothetical protein
MTNTQTIQKTLDTIKSYSNEAALAVIPYLKKSDLETYKNFLNEMYHYTLKSGDKLMQASKASPNPELKDFFDHMFREERLHYVLAEQDLKGFGLKPNYEKTPQAVTDFNNFWESLGKGHFNGFLAALYIFENVAEKVADDIKGMIQRLEITEKQRRWLSLHSEADVEHGQLIGDLLAKYIDQDVDKSLAAAAEAKEKWIAVLESAFTIK